MKRHSILGVILKRELGAWFSSFVAWLVYALFLVISGFLFFSTFFLANRAELRSFFGLLPILFSFFIPAITMRLFSEESRSGSLETLMTLPVTSTDVTIGKYLAAFISCAVMLTPTLLYIVAATIFGNPDPGPIIGGYLGALFLAAAFCAIGVFASSMSKNQIVAFFVAFAISILLSMIDQFLVLLPASLASFFTFFSATKHFESVARGIIDSRDLLYFASLTAIFLVLTVKSLQIKTVPDRRAE